MILLSQMKKELRFLFNETRKDHIISQLDIR